MRRLMAVAAVATLLSVAAARTASAAEAKDIWKDKCAKCHGEDGKGQTKIGQKLGIKDFTDAKTQDGFKDDAAFKAIKEGLKDKEDKITMKAAEGVSDDEIKALIGYVRSLKK